MGLDSGKAFLLPTDFDKGQYCYTNNNPAMMRLYSLCDQAYSPLYLMDHVLAQLKGEISEENVLTVQSIVSRLLTLRN